MLSLEDVEEPGTGNVWFVVWWNEIEKWNFENLLFSYCCVVFYSSLNFS